MKLYYTPGACSLAPHIALREAGLPVDLAQVDLKTKRVEDGRDFAAVNPKGYVPALELDDGSVMAEAAAILQLIADRAPAGALRPERDTAAYYAYLEWLTYVSSELHKGLGALFNPALTGDSRAAAVTKVGERLSWLDGVLATRSYLNGTFSAADAYLFTVTGWAPLLKVDLSPYPNLLAYRARIGARPAVRDAMRAEGLPVAEAA